MSVGTFKIRNFVKAKSEKRLRTLMYEKQLQLKMAALQFDIVHANGYWFGWYYELISDKALEEVIDGNTKNNRR